MGVRPGNPPASPQNDWSFAGGDGREGMTLRDWFAGQALPVVPETYPEWQLKAWFGNRTGLRREEIRARAAYAIADAMLLSRQENPNG